MSRQPCFTTQAWSATSVIRLAIDDHPFLRELADGTLPESTFTGYLAQDAHYLIGYSRALSLCAAQATTPDDIAFWASSARDAIVVERSLHDVRVGGLPAVEPSPTCRAYLSFLLGTASEGSYPVLAAALLPCFWIYEDVGRRLKDTVELDGHPYADWISTYGDPGFAAATERVRVIVDRLAQQGGDELRRSMHTAFAVASRYEWMFWDSAWQAESWPGFAAAKGSAASTATTNEAMEADSHG